MTEPAKIQSGQRSDSVLIMRVKCGLTITDCERKYLQALLEANRRSQAILNRVLYSIAVLIFLIPVLIGEFYYG